MYCGIIQVLPLAHILPSIILQARGFPSPISSSATDGRTGTCAISLPLITASPRCTTVDPPRIRHQGVDHLQEGKAASRSIFYEPNADILRSSDVPRPCTAHRWRRFRSIQDRAGTRRTNRWPIFSRRQNRRQARLSARTTDDVPCRRPSTRTSARNTVRFLGRPAVQRVRYDGVRWCRPSLAACRCVRPWRTEDFLQLGGARVDRGREEQLRGRCRAGLTGLLGEEFKHPVCATLAG